MNTLCSCPPFFRANSQLRVKQVFEDFEITDQTDSLQSPKVIVSSIELVKSLLGRGLNALCSMNCSLCRADGALSAGEELEERCPEIRKESQMFFK